MAIVAKRTVMTLYSDIQDPYSHQVRIVLAEKGVNVEIHYVKPGEPLEDLVAINPYVTVPTLVDRELVLYEPRIIMEYLDERFPHPPLLPVYPVARAESRKLMFRVEQDWYSLLHMLEQGDEQQRHTARQHLLESILSLEPVFADKPYFWNDEFTLTDCTIAPLFWRLPQYGIHIPASAKAVHAYCKRLFERDAFQASLTEIEKELQEAA